MTGGLTHGDLAQVRRKVDSGGVTLARFCDHDGDGEDAHWVYFGTDWTDRHESVEVVQRVEVVPL
ncbi:hypothetical protein ACQPYE_08375 [Actinosynnema sp. CA-299493]